MLDIILDTIIDALKILPFLWLAFFIIELLEHRYSDKAKNVIQKGGRFGPLIGGILGCFPQCGFSVLATNFYITRIITLGTLISVYLSTSDEMLPILLSHGTNITTILQLIGVKLLIGIVAGFIIDLLYRQKPKMNAHEFCQHDHCHCEKDGIVRSSLNHTIHTLTFIALVSLFINIIMEYGGSDILTSIFSADNLFAPFLSSLIGLIPNCGASVIITELYLSGVIPFSCVISGLLTGSGVALIVLFKNNDNIKENIFVLLTIYLIGALSGVIIEFITALI